MTRTRAAIVATTLALVAAATVPAGAGAGTEASCDWPMYGREAGRSFAQDPACAAVDLSTAPTLRPKWVVPVADSVTASPAIKDGILYVGSWDGTFYALDAETGDVLWTFAIDDDHDVAFGRIVSSAAVDTVTVPGSGPQQVVLFGGGATLYALAHSRTGPTLLATVDADPRADQTAGDPEVEIESSPVVGHFPDGDRIFVGMDVHNREGVGRTGLLSFGLRSNTGGATPFRFELLYKFDPETSTVRHSLTEGSGDGFGCGGVWSSPMLAYEGGAGVLVFGTSNCTNPEDAAAAGELDSEAVFAIEAKTGALRWRFKPRDGNVLDDDFGATPNLLDGNRVGAGGKDGTYYILDLTTGTLVHEVRAGQAGHVSDQFAIGGILGSPAVGRDIPLSPMLPAFVPELVFATTAFGTPIGNPLGPARRSTRRSSRTRRAC